MTETDNGKTPSGGDQAGSPLSYGKALTGVVEKLHNQILLFILGAAIIFLAAAALGREELRMLTIPLLILFILGTFGWLFQQVRKTRSDGGGAVKFGFGVEANDVEINTGVSRASNSKRAAEGGPVTARSLGKLENVKIDTSVKDAADD